MYIYSLSIHVYACTCFFMFSLPLSLSLFCSVKPRLLTHAWSVKLILILRDGDRSLIHVFFEHTYNRQPLPSRLVWLNSFPVWQHSAQPHITGLHTAFSFQPERSECRMKQMAEGGQRWGRLWEPVGPRWSSLTTMTKHWWRYKYSCRHYLKSKLIQQQGWQHAYQSKITYFTEINEHTNSMVEDTNW